MKSPPEPKEPRKARGRLARWARRLAVLVLLAVGGLGFLVWTGWPQRKLIELVLSRTLAATVEIDGLSMGSVVRIAHLALYDSADGGLQSRPVIHVEGVRLDWTLCPRDGRYVEAFEADSLAVFLDAHVPRDTNFDFLVALLTRPQGPIDPIHYLPREIRVERGEFELILPERRFATQGFRFAGRVADLTHFEVTFTGEPVAGQAVWGSLTTSVMDGIIRVGIQRDGANLLIEPLEIRLPGIVETTGTVRGPYFTESPRLEGELAAQLGQAMVIASFRCTPSDHFDGSALLDSVPVGELMAVLTEKVPVSLQTMRVSGPVEISVKEDIAVKTELDMTGLFPDSRQPIRLQAEGVAGLPPAIWPVRVLGQATFPKPGKGKVEFACNAENATPDFEVRSSLDHVSVNLLASLIQPEGLPADWDAVVSGTVDISGTAEGLWVRLALESPGISLGGFTIPEEENFTVQTTCSVPPGFSEVRGDSGRFRVGDWLDGSATTWSVVFAPFELHALLSALVDFDRAPSSFLGGVSTGTLSFGGPLQYRNGILEARPRLKGEGLGYASWMPPLSTRTEAEAQLIFSPAKRTLSVKGLWVTWGDGSRLTTEAFTLATRPFAGQFSFALDTDLTPLADLFLIQSVEGGRGSFRGTVAFGPERPQFEAQGTAQAEALALTEGRALLQDLAVSGEIAHGTALEGTGELRAAEVAALGTTLSSVQSNWTAKDGVIYFDGLAGQVLAGQFQGSARVGPLETGWPARLEVVIESLDLARFTEEFQPSNTRITGLASGQLRLAWDAEGIQDLDLDLLSTERFSVNRELLEQLLLSQFTKTATGVKKIEAIRARVLGDAPQRPFDQAELHVNWADSRYVGQVVLQSKDLNLTIDIGADAEVVAEALRLRQEAQFEKLAIDL